MLMARLTGAFSFNALQNVLQVWVTALIVD